MCELVHNREKEVALTMQNMAMRLLGATQTRKQKARLLRWNAILVRLAAECGRLALR